ncbi:NAD(P)/FAD-dependent oxidoreductase [Clostridia bacterium]|nr:NAD(P)/FAD-dependent oxidoreductase [Clostridia bacterium]
MSVIVIGGGVSGMMAAIAAAQKGAKVVLLEHKQKLGIKLSITGKGRCNLTNIASQDDFLSQVPDNSRFLYSSLNQFSSQDLRDFFENHGCPLKEERGGRVFPKSDSAKDIVQVLTKQLQVQTVEVRTNVEVTKVFQENGCIQGVILSNGETLLGTVIIATGGKSYPLTGSDGSGYRFARDFGHTTTKLFPSLVGLYCKDEWIEQLAGLSLRNVNLCVGQGKKKREAFGEMLFTHQGISGPIVLTLSRHIVKQLNEKDSVEVFLDFKPALTEDILDQRLIREFSENAKKDLVNVMKSLLPSALIPVILKISELEPHMKCHAVNKQDRQGLISALKHLRLTVTGHAGYKEAIVTQGGINVREVNPKTMASKKMEGLYMAGEMLDLDAYTGGYNLQIAFSTGYVAGVHAAAYDKEKTV